MSYRDSNNNNLLLYFMGKSYIYIIGYYGTWGILNNRWEMLNKFHAPEGHIIVEVVI